MDAQVMLIRTGRRRVRARCGTPLTFGEWVDHGHPLGFPTLDDLDYHLTTLFPPVRPRGWLELRMVDSLPQPWWRVPVAVAAALVYDAEAGEAAAQAAWDTADLWVRGVPLRAGPPRPGRRRPGLLPDRPGGAARAWARATDTLDAVAEYLDRYVDRGRCPADDVLDHWRRTGGLFLPGDRSWAAVPPAAVRP